MFSQKFLLPAFAVISVAAAQTASICSQATATINSQADATQYADCSTIKGSVLIGPDAAGVISLDGPQQITGDLTCLSASGLTSFSSASIGTIGGAFHFENLTLLSTLQMSDLTTTGSILFQALPALSTLTFTSVVSAAKSLTVSNTFLSTLSGINLATVATMDIDNNNHLKSFDTQVSNITSMVNINANGNNLAVTFPNLIWAANMTFRNVSSVSIPSLAVVNGSLGFYGNSMQNILAPNLTAVGSKLSNVGSLAFVDNTALGNISMPNLVSVGGANQIANNTALHGISFPALQYVGGAIDFGGNFTTPDLPALVNVKGGFNIESQQAINCDAFQAEAGVSNVIQGKFVCEGSVGTPTNLAGATATSSSSSSSSTSKGAATSYGVSEAVAGVSIVGAIFQLLL